MDRWMIMIYIYIYIKEMEEVQPDLSLGTDIEFSRVIMVI